VARRRGTSEPHGLRATDVRRHRDQGNPQAFLVRGGHCGFPAGIRPGGSPDAQPSAGFVAWIGHREPPVSTSPLRSTGVGRLTCCPNGRRRRGQRPGGLTELTAARRAQPFVSAHGRVGRLAVIHWTAPLPVVALAGAPAADDPASAYRSGRERQEEEISNAMPSDGEGRARGLCDQPVRRLIPLRIDAVRAIGRGTRRGPTAAAMSAIPDRHI
jgi:hypothetical protein